jgi:hypothetical protein
MEMARNIYTMKDAKFLFFRRDYLNDSEYESNSRYIYTIFSRQYNAFLVNPDTEDITFVLGYHGYLSKNEDTIKVYDKNLTINQEGGKTVLKTYDINELISDGFLKPATIPFSAPLHEVKRQEQMGEPMADAVNERMEFDMDDIKEMILEAFNNIKKDE